jgi:hypothetical protein
MRRKTIDMKLCTAAAVGFLALSAYMTHLVVRLENVRYAMSLDMCRTSDIRPDLPHLAGFDRDCLDRKETRTSWVWHLYYAVTN